MKTLRENLLSLAAFYKDILKSLEEREGDQGEEKKAEGSIIVYKVDHGCQFYLQKKDEETGKFKRRFLKKEEQNLAKDIIQETYEEKVRRLVTKRLKQLGRFIRTLHEGEIDQLYLNLSEERKKLVDPVILPYEEALALWKSQPYQSMGFQEDTQKIYSNNGERVRSKSEKILADKFKSMGIVYKYEKPLALGENLLYSPDFTFLCPRTRQEIYWEHLGMMDDPNYVNKAMIKIKNYEKYGLYQGERLIITFESSSQSLNTRWVDSLIRRHLLP